jgi:hypothetical protein
VCTIATGVLLAGSWDPVLSQLWMAEFSMNHELLKITVLSLCQSMPGLTDAKCLGGGERI